MKDKVKELNAAVYSKEVRWFFTEKPVAVELWFNTYESFVETSEERTDYYLVMHPHDNISYKLREGKTEIKMRLGEAIPSHFPNNHAGKTDGWVKWSMALKKKIDSPDMLYDAGEKTFIALLKKRKLITFDVLPDGTATIVRSDHTSVESCQVEFTSLQYNDKIWFSFGFEATGSRSLIERNFDAVTQAVLGEIDKMVLEEKDSYGYPAFLALLKP